MCIYLQTYYSGLSFNWCCPNSTSCLSKILHSISIPFYFCLIVSNAMFQGFQLFQEILKNDNNIHAYTTNLIWFSTSPLTILILCHLFFKSEQLLSFFTEWRRMEIRFMSNSNLDLANARKVKYFIICILCIIDLANWIGIYWFIMFRPNESYLLSHFEFIRINIGLPLVTVYHLLVIVTSNIYVWHSDILPGFIFHRASLFLRSLELNMEHIFCEWNRDHKMPQGSAVFEKRMSEMCLRYEMVSKLVNQANQLFGALMIVNHGTVLFMICVMAYSMLYHIHASPIDAIIYFSGFSTFALLLTVGHLLAAKLHSAALSLRSTLSSLKSQNSVQLTKKEFNVAFTLLVRLQEDQLAARPLNLYTVTASNLLTFTTLIITYVIVLLQA